MICIYFDFKNCLFLVKESPPLFLIKQSSPKSLPKAKKKKKLLFLRYP